MDSESLRPGAASIDRLNAMLPATTAGEVERMADLSVVFDEVVSDLASSHGAPTVDTNGAFWADQGKMADDGIHPNGSGHADLAGLWLKVIEPLL